MRPSTMPPLLSCRAAARAPTVDRKSTRLNSSHSQISYAVFCLKKKKKKTKKKKYNTKKKKKDMKSKQRQKKRQTKFRHIDHYFIQHATEEKSSSRSLSNYMLSR